MTIAASQPLEGFELSPQQARLWHAQRACPGATTATLALAATRPFDADLLRRSLETLARRHEILRTRYRGLPGMAAPMQEIAQPGEPLEALGLDLELSGDRLRATLRLPALHADAASLGALADAWAHAYIGRSAGEPPMQYADYAAWRSEAVDPQGRRFWEARLAAAASGVPLPLRRHAPAPSAPSASARQAVALEASQHAAWQQAAARLGCAPAIVALAAWLALWHRHSEADRLTCGIEFQHRSGPLAAAVGLFSEPLPLTLENLGEASFEALCRSIDEQCAALAEWRDSYPSERHALPDAPVLAVGFRDLPRPPGAALSDAGWRIEQAASPTAALPLLLEHQEGRADPLVLQADASLYGPSHLAGLADQLATLLENACREPALRLSELPATSARELHRLTAELAAAPALSETQQRQYEEIASLPHLSACLGRQATRAADRPAVSGPGGTLSYAQLEARADALAQRLLARGVGGGAPVAHFLPRDVDAIVALLAILKAGACYVPVDPAYPAERIAHILADSQAELVITRRALQSGLPDAWASCALAIDEQAPACPPQRWPAIDLQQPAYLIYTSGSTGRPKGVVITHANALHSLAARLAYYPQPVQRFLLLSSFAFDSSIAGLFWSLAQGGCLHLASEEQQKDPSALAGMIREHGVSHLLALPSLHALLLDQLGATRSPLEAVIVAGEACPPALVETHFECQPQARLYNEYGPTEAAVWSTVAECHAGQGARPVPIGRAIPHTRIYLLDAQGTPVARGMKGEIHIAGPGLSPGYLNRPELTAERFVHARHPALSGERLYRTGDHAYLDDDDRVVFLGRADAQVKLRGYRIELGEIEAALAAVTGAAQTVVLLDTSPTEPRLRAFVETGTALDPAAVGEALARRLPSFMLPADILGMPALPRTANGKADARALLALASGRARPAHAAPRTGIELALAALWEELLGQPRIGLHDDFFALGGHSLLVVKLVHRLRSALQVQVPVGAVFQHRTLAQLAAHLAGPAEARTGAASALVTLHSGAAGRSPLFCLHRPAGDVQHYVPLLAALPGDLPVRGLVLPAGRGPDTASLAELAAIYAVEVRSAQPRGPYRLCGWSMGGLLALELARRLEQQGEKVEFLALVDTTFHAEDGALSFGELLAVVQGELVPESRARLAAMPGDALDELRRETAPLGKVDQLQCALLAWSGRHGLRLNAPASEVETHLAAMRAARRWLDGYAPPRVESTLQLWWAADTLVRRPTLPAQWDATGSPIVHHRMPGDHDSILAEPVFQRAFNAALSR